FKIGKTLRSLKEEDILVIGSGVTLHNLRRIDWRDDAPIAPWAKAFHEWINDAVKNLDFKRLASWKEGPNALDAVPRPEHFAPLLILSASATEGSTPCLTYSEIQMGSLSYDVWRFD
ncbi:MAG TPA: dioxygenase, partial [Erysipelotrichaceae bacterium]|nr:dioxygenase [Erysipelotrichaceae bacterium]